MSAFHSVSHRLQRLGNLGVFRSGGGGAEKCTLSFMTMFQHMHSHIAHFMRYNRRK